MTIPPLRPYQKRDYRALRDAMRRHRRCVMVAPTGYGKTRLAGELVLEERRAGRRVMMLCPWRELVGQAVDRFAAIGISAVGVMMSGYEPRPDAQVIVGSVESVRQWIDVHPELAQVDVVILDEAHRYGTELRRGLLETTWAHARVVGITATPFRAAAGGLGDLFDGLVVGASMDELIEAGHLVPPRFWSTDPRELATLRPLDGRPFERPSSARSVGDVLEEWQRHGLGTTLAFTSGVRASRELAARFGRVGVAAEHLDAQTPDVDRRAILGRLAAGDTQVVCNHGVLTEGYDLPIVETIILRPTSSLMLYLQMVGRGLRPAPGKTHCRVLDPAGLVYRFGLPQDYRLWSLDHAPTPRPLSEVAAREVRQLAEPARGGRDVEGRLAEVRGLPEDATAVLARLEAQATASGYGAPWAVAEYRRRFGCPPPVPRLRRESRAWLKRQQVAAGLPAPWVHERLRELFGP